MDADNAPQRRPVPGHGGAVEPANRATVAKARFQTPPEPAGARYELRDPFAEVTYRASSMAEMAAKAEQLGSQRFVAIAQNGQRSMVQKVGDQWQREGQQEAEPTAQQPQRPAQAAPQAPLRSPKPERPEAPESPANPQTQAIAKIDAQAERTALVARLEAALADRYIVKRAPVSVGELSIGRTEYRFRGDTGRVAFTESTFRLATDTNSPSVARSMVDLAEARNWKALRVSGHEEFRRLVWFEASLRGVKAIGYEPMPSDMAWLRSEREARLVNRIEPARDASASSATSNLGTSTASTKGSARGGGSRKAVLAAIEAVLVAQGVPEKKREAVMAAATEKLAQRQRDGQAPRLKVYDKSAPSQRPMPVPTQEVQRSRDRTAPAPAR